MAEFETPAETLAAAQRAYAAGYRHMDAYSPFPVEGMPHALGRSRTWLPLIVLAGGCTGAGTAFFLQWFATVVDYPLNVGGRPYFSWPMYIPITFELTILFAAFAAVFGMLILNRLPKPYHPVFNVRNFEHASDNRFFLCIEATDPSFDRAATAEFLQAMEPLAVSDVKP
jgi:hypothetical protein